MQLEKGSLVRINLLEWRSRKARKQQQQHKTKITRRDDIFPSSRIMLLCSVLIIIMLCYFVMCYVVVCNVITHGGGRNDQTRIDKKYKFRK